MPTSFRNLSTGRACFFTHTALGLGALLLHACTAVAQDRVFEVIPPDEVAFNYPAPPREAAPDYFAIAENGEARCVIVHPDGSRGARRAASAFRTYLALVTDARFSVIPESRPIPAGMAAIHVGDTAVARMAPLGLPDVRYGQDALPNLNGYLVQTLDSRTLVIRSRTDTALMHGVVGFLKRYAGVRQYWLCSPGGIGEVVPSRPTLRVPQVEWRDWPYFFSRSMSMKLIAASKHATVDFFRRNGTLRCNENYNVWLPPKKHGATHPRYYSLVNGKRRVPSDGARASGWQPCVSNPEVAPVMGEAVTGYFRRNPDAVGINFAINDGGGDCTCEGCCALDAPNTDYAQQVGMSDRYVKLTNQVCDIVRREFPSKLLVYLAYAAGRSAPQSVKPDPMMLPVLTVPGNAFASWDSWMKTGVDHMGLYVHHDDDFMFILPKLDIHQMARRIRYAVGSGRARIFYMEAFPHWPISGLVAYVAAELLWDPRQDVDALLDEYYTNFFGPAAEPMKTFYETLEAGYERWLQEASQPHWFGKDVSSTFNARRPEQFRVLAVEEAARASAALAKAATAAAKDQRAAERVNVVRLMFRLQELGARHYWTTERLKTQPVKSEADAQRVVADARELLALGRELSDYINNVLEKPPADAYRLFRRSPTARHQNQMYERMKSGAPAPEVGVAITTGVDEATGFLRESLGPEEAAAWWRNVGKDEQEPLLIATFEAAEMRAKGVEIQNLVADSGFEEIGKKLGPDELAPERYVVLDRNQQAKLGIRLWFPERSPYRCVLTEEAPHSGRYSLGVENCYRARFSRYAKVEPGAHCRAAVWFKHNRGRGAYRFAVDAKTAAGKYPTLASVPIPKKPGEWQQLVVDVTMPAKARLILLRVYINRQTSEAQCGIDDVFIGQYPK